MNEGNVMILKNIFPIMLLKQSKFCKHIDGGIVQLTDILVQLAFSVCISPPLFFMFLG